MVRSDGVGQVHHGNRLYSLFCLFWNERLGTQGLQESQRRCLALVCFLFRKVLAHLCLLLASMDAGWLELEKKDQKKKGKTNKRKGTNLSERKQGVSGSVLLLRGGTETKAKLLEGSVSLVLRHNIFPIWPVCDAVTAVLIQATVISDLGLYYQSLMGHTSTLASTTVSYQYSSYS